MKVALLTQRFPPALGGVENHVLHLAQGLVARGDDVEVLTTDLRTDIPFERLDGHEEEFSFPVHRLRAMRAAVLPHALGNVAPAMLPRILHGNWDLIHGHAYGYFSTFASAVAGSLDRSVLVITPHSDPGRASLRKRAFDAVVPFVTLQRAVRVIALTNREARYLEGLGVSPDRIAVIPNGVDVTEFFPPPNRSDRGDGTTVLFAGRCYPQQKGLEILLHAVSSLPKDCGIHLRIVGEDWGGYAVVRELSKQAHIENRVTLVGCLTRPQLIDEFRRADVFVLPSLFDSFPLTVLEAMAAGLPVIATRVGGIPEIVEDGRSGLLVDPSDPRALSSALERLASDRSLRLEMGRSGRERAQIFSWEHTISMTRRLYDEAFGEREAT